MDKALSTMDCRVARDQYILRNGRLTTDIQATSKKLSHFKFLNWTVFSFVHLYAHAIGFKEDLVDRVFIQMTQTS